MGTCSPRWIPYGLVLGDINGTYGVYGGEDDFQLKPFDRIFLGAGIRRLPLQVRQALSSRE